MNIIDFENAKHKCSESRPYCKKLLWFIQDFISQIGAAYYVDESDPTKIRLYYRFKNDIAVEQEIIVREADCLCYTTLSITLRAVEEGYTTKLCDLLFQLNEINCALDYGNFEYCSGNGDIRFKTSFEPGEGIICYEDMDKFIYYSHFAVNKYGEVIRKVLNRE